MTDLARRFPDPQPWPTDAIRAKEQELHNTRASLHDARLQYGELLDIFRDPRTTSRTRHLARLKLRSLARQMGRLRAHARKAEKALNDMRGGTP